MTSIWISAIWTMIHSGILTGLPSPRNTPPTRTPNAGVGVGTVGTSPSNTTVGLGTTSAARTNTTVGVGGVTRTLRLRAGRAATPPGQGYMATRPTVGHKQPRTVPYQPSPSGSPSDPGSRRRSSASSSGGSRRRRSRGGGRGSGERRRRRRFYTSLFTINTESRSFTRDDDGDEVVS